MPDTPNPESVFAEFLAAGSSRDIDELCALHPAAADDLRAMHREWIAMESAIHGPLSIEDPTRGESAAGLPSTVSTVRAIDAAAWDRFVEQLRTRSEGGPRYAPLHELGRGGMGIVNRVFDPTTRRYLAKKVLRDRPQEEGSPGAPGSRLSRFLEEAQVTAQLDHPCVVPVHEVGIDPDGAVFFTMKEVRGETLASVLSKSALDQDGWSRTRVLQVILKVCEGVAFAHAKGVIHRDLKPDNIMVGQFGETYVMDWGLARIIHDQEGHDLRVVEGPIRTFGTEEIGSPAQGGLHTQEGEALGTPYYMSPEQAEGRPTIGPATDIYSMGAILYQLLAGAPPYHDPTSRRSAQEVLRQVQRGSLRPIAELAPLAPPELIAVCEKAMDRRAGQRYPRMTALAADLQAYLENRVVVAHGGGALAQLRLWVRRNRGMAAGIGIATIAAMVAMVVAAVGIQQRGALKNERGLVAQLRDAESKAREAQSQAEADRAQAVAGREAARKEAGRSDALAREKEELAEREQAAAKEARAAEREASQAREQSERAAQEVKEASEELTDRNRELKELAAELDQRRQELESNAITLDTRTRELEESLVNAIRFAVDASRERARRLWIQGDDLWPIGSKIEPELVAWNEAAKKLRLDTEGAHAGFSEFESLMTEEDWAGLRALDELIAQMSSDDLIQPTFQSMEYRTKGAATLRIWAENSKPVWESLAAEGSASDQEMKPVEGLVPMGRNPRTGLHEFWHPLSGPLPEAGLAPDPDRHTGMVFVLIPPRLGFFGAQAEDPYKWVYDPDARAIERPKKLGANPRPALLVARTEITVNQLRTLYGLPEVQGTMGQLPARDLSKGDALKLYDRFGLRIPDEQEWECAARGTSGSLPRWTGPDLATMRAAANVHGADDGYAGVAPVGRFLPNGFGLYDVLGNVAEWVRPRQDLYEGVDYLEVITMDDLLADAPDGASAWVARRAAMLEPGESLAVATERDWIVNGEEVELLEKPSAPLFIVSDKEITPRLCRGSTYSSEPRQARSARRMFWSPEGGPQVGVRLVIDP